LMFLGLGIAGVSEIVGAFGGRKCSEDFADCDADGFGRARGGLAQQVLELGEDLSIGVRSGEYFGRKKSLAPAARSCFCRVASCPWTINKAFDARPTRLVRKSRQRRCLGRPGLWSAPMSPSAYFPRSRTGAFELCRSTSGSMTPRRSRLWCCLRPYTSRWRRRSC